MAHVPFLKQRLSAADPLKAYIGYWQGRKCTRVVDGDKMSILTIYSTTGYDRLTCQSVAYSNMFKHHTGRDECHHGSQT